MRTQVRIDRNEYTVNVRDERGVLLSFVRKADGVALEASVFDFWEGPLRFTYRDMGQILNAVAELIERPVLEEARP